MYRAGAKGSRVRTVREVWGYLHAGPDKTEIIINGFRPVGRTACGTVWGIMLKVPAAIR